jgi:cytochrome P450
MIIALLPITIILLILGLIYYQAKKQASLITNNITKKPLQNVVPLLEPLFYRIYHRWHVTRYALMVAKKFSFEPFMTFVGYKGVFVVSQPELAKKMLLNWRAYEKMTLFTPHSRAVLGMNLVFLNGEEWKKQRSIVNPAFFNIDRFSQDFMENTRICLNGIEQALNNGIINVPMFMTALTLDILGQTVFDHKFDYVKEMVQKSKGESIDPEKSKIIESYDYVMNNFVSVLKIFGGEFYAKLPIESNKKFESSLKNLEHLVYSLIDKSKKKIQSGSNTGGETLLDMMVNSVDDETKEGFDQKTLRDNVIVFFIAGHDTTSIALSYALYSLAKYPHVQEKLVNSIQEKYGLGDSDISVEQIDDIEYLNWFIKENMRLYPPVGQLPPRKLVSTEVLGDYTLSAGTLATINIYNIHHNPNVWGKDVEEFRPERFSPEESKNRHSNAYMPFGGGPRTCIGNRFSLLEQKIFLVQLLRRFKLELPDPTYIAKPSYMGTGLHAAPKDLNMRFLKRVK